MFNSELQAGKPFFDGTDTIPAQQSLRFPLQDRRGNEFSPKSNNPFDLPKPSSFKDSIAYDPETKTYVIYEKIGRSWYRTPGWMTFEEMQAYQAKKAEQEYFRRRMNTILDLNRKVNDPKLKVRENYFNRLFSNTGIPKVEIRPQGDITLTAGYIGQNIKNPTLPERARRNGGFDFDMQANFGLNAKIGDKLNFPVTYNTLANFQFENQLKLNYSGNTDQIIKKIEAGNVAFPAKGTLMPGASTLFGIKTELQFGKLFVTTVLANQNSSRQQMQLQGGAGLQNFEVKADEYEENRHFLVSQYFRKNYNKNMQNIPAVTTPVQILRMEVWVTNRTGSTTENRNVVAFMDLGENQPYNPNVQPLTSSDFPENGANDLYQRIAGNPVNRDASLVTSNLSAQGLVAVQDFERTFARKLRPEEYYFNAQIGFISLNTVLQPDEVLGVAFQYTVNGKVYQVGEFSNDITPDTTSNNAGTQKVLFLKMLKATSQRPLLPIWRLMMKNVYAVGYGQLERKDFKFNILYQEPGGGVKRYIPEGEEKGRPILELVNLDRLNNQNDPQQDGVFDYIEGFTVNSQQSRIIFPLLEPFGKDLEYIFRGPDAAELKRKYLFYPLYDSIKWVAQQSPQLNRFVFRGSSRSAGGSSEIPIGAFNVPQGSVTVTAGGQTLRENVDYVVDYNLGTVKVINQAIINANLPIQVGFENNATFGMQNRNFMALRLDYRAIESQTRQLNLGAAVMRLGERPFFTKMNYGDDPIRNTMIGGDLNFRSDWKRLTKWLDALPFYTTRQNSSVAIYGEGARIMPSTARQIRPEKGEGGLVYIDDFEGTRNGIDLRFPFIAWTLASTPSGSKDRFGVDLFPEAGLSNNLAYGYNRSRMSWYNIEPVLQERRSINNPLGDDLDELSDPRVRFVNRVEVFPQSTPDLGQNQLITFDLAFYPKDRGPYNFDARPGSVNSLTGKLNNPKSRWGGIMRAIDQIDFETNNIEFIEMWVQDPFILNPTASGGQLYFNLGNISEDILKDGRRFYENGLSTTQTQAREDTSLWARAYGWLAESDLTPRSFGLPLYPERPAPSPEDFGERYLPHYFDGTRPFDGRAFLLRVGEEDVGCLVHHAVDLYRDAVELELWLAQARHCGKGYGSEAVTLACEWLQDNLGVNRFLLRPSRRNVRALRAMRRAGFRETDLPQVQVLQRLALKTASCDDEVLLLRMLPPPGVLLERVAGQTCVFVDSEFTSLHEPRLISVGAVATDGTSFYCELNDWPPEFCSEFVRNTVLPLLDGDAVPHPVAAAAFRRWIEAKVARGPTVIVSDSGYDRWALADLLASEDLPPGTRWLRLPVAYEVLDETAAALGLRRHHALDDARALRHAALNP